MKSVRRRIEVLVALIMAGGKGTRFWPASTEEKPKQFLSLVSKNSMIQETVNRVLPLIDINHIFICTNERYEQTCLEQLQNLPQRNIIVEPEGRNTAPCILLSTLYISQIYSDATILVLPSDAAVMNTKEQNSVLADAEKYLQKRDGIVTIGITPCRPETGYGYIKQKEQSEKIGSHEVRVVECFKEKPQLETAKQYLENGNYLWNAGIFMFDANYMITEYRKHAKKIYDVLAGLPPITDEKFFSELSLKYKDCEKISIDYAIIEKTDKLYVIPANIGWDDIGSWTALERYLEKDEKGNIVVGNVDMLGSKNNVVYSTSKPVTLLNVEELFVIEADDRLIIGRKEDLCKVSEIQTSGKNNEKSC